MTPETAALLEAAGDRLAFHVGGSPTSRGAALRKALEDGVAAPEALEKAGAPAPLVRCFAAAAVPDLPAALEPVARAWGAARARERELRSTALYPAVLALAAMALGWIVAYTLDPALRWVGASDAVALPAAEGADPRLLAPLFLGALALVLLAGVLAADLPLPPFAGARRLRERALFTCAASALADAGAALPAALRGAAELSRDPALRDAGLAAAGALERGETMAPAVLLGDTGSAIFAAAAANGAGPAALAALADVHEGAARSEQPLVLARASLATLLVGALAVGAAAVWMFLVYAGALGRAG